MKKILIISAAVLFLASCEKLGLGKKHKPCATVSQDAVPLAVISTFQTMHPGITAKTWFNKDNSGFVALFDNSGKETKDYFDNSGNFQKEEVDDENQQGNHRDGDDDDSGCECGTDD